MQKTALSPTSSSILLLTFVLYFFFFLPLHTNSASLLSQLCFPTLWASQPAFMEQILSLPQQCNRAREGTGIIQVNKIHQEVNRCFLKSQTLSKIPGISRSEGSLARDQQGCCLWGVFWPVLGGGATKEREELKLRV